MGLMVFGWVVFGVFCRFLWRVRNVGLDVMHSKDVNISTLLLARGRDRLETQAFFELVERCFLDSLL